MARTGWFALLSVLSAVGVYAPTALAEPPAMYVVDETEVVREEAPPHGAIGMSTAFRISDGADDRTMEFRKRALHPGAAVGAHRTSMLQDLDAGRPMEIDALVASVQELGRLTGKPTPTIDTVLGLIRLRAKVAGLY